MVEELKVIMEAMQHLGAEGKEAFIWYLGMQLASELIWQGVVLTLILATYKVLKGLIKSCTTIEVVGRSVGRITNTTYDTWSSYDQRSLVKTIDKIVEQHINRNK